MSRQTKFWLIAATSLVLLGCIIFVGVMTVMKWDFKKLSTAKYETNRYELSEVYENIAITAKTSDVVFVPSENDRTTVVCYEQKNMKHSVQVKDGTLVIACNDSRKWYEYIGISFDRPKITVYIPQGEYSALSVKSDTGKVEIPEDFRFESMDIAVSTGHVKNYACVKKDMKIRTSTGHILVDNVSAGSMELSVSTGDLTVNKVLCDGAVQLRSTTGETYLTDIACKDLQSKGSTGDLTMSRVIVAGKLAIERSTGDTKLDSCDAAEILIETDTGDVKGNLLSEKIFIARTDTGKVDVPKTITGGKCEITTDTGDIIITIK